MCQWMRQFSVLAQGDDVGEWVNILIIVVMAVFWVIGGLAKSLSQNKRQKQGGQPPSKRPSSPVRAQRRETWLQQVARKAEELQKAAAQRMQEMERQAQGQPRSRPKPAQMPVRSARVQATPPRPVRSSQESVQGSAAEAARLYTPEPAPKQLEYEPSLGVDLSDPQALRKAILHYEILGKPLAMRYPFDSGF